MTNALNRWLPSLTLAAWSAILLYFHLSGRLSAFLHPSFRPGVLIAGIFLLIFALGSARGGAPECGDDCGCGHSVTRFTFGKVLAFLVLLLPLFLAFANSRDSFGISAIQNRGVAMSASEMPGRPAALPSGGEPDQFVPPRTAGGNLSVSILDLLYAAQDPDLRKDFEGNDVELIGQLMQEKVANPNGHRMKVIRMVMNCCAADAKPIATLIELRGTTDLPELSWVRVAGTATFPTEGGRTIAVLKVSSMDVTDPPEESMLY
jgi:uncharacterized repeat protein (TIGR03943 family)